jgi:ASCH domain-containing protein
MRYMRSTLLMASYRRLRHIAVNVRPMASARYARKFDSAVRALSIGQPWAELILRRRKPFEIRSRNMKYRGLLILHASKKIKTDAAQKLGIDPRKLDRGAFVGWAYLSDVRPYTRSDARILRRRKAVTEKWQPGSYALVLKKVRRIKPVPFKGQLGLFKPPATLLRRICAHYQHPLLEESRAPMKSGRSSRRS